MNKILHQSTSKELLLFAMKMLLPNNRRNRPQLTSEKPNNNLLYIELKIENRCTRIAPPTSHCYSHPIKMCKTKCMPQNESS